MATVTGLTAPRMLEIEANSIVEGTVDENGHLQLITHGGAIIDAGKVKGDKGEGGAAGPAGPVTAPQADPIAPTALTVVSNTGFHTPAGQPVSTVVFSWSPVLMDVLGDVPAIDMYELWYRIPTGTSNLLAQTGNVTTTTVDTMAPGVSYLVKIRAHTLQGGWGAFSTEIPVTTAVPSSLVPNDPGNVAIVANVGQYRTDGRSESRIKLVWDAVTTSVDAQPIGIQTYEVWLTLEGATTPLLTTPETEVFLTFPSGILVDLKVKAMSNFGIWGDFSESDTVTTAFPSQNNAAASAPVLTTNMGVVYATWNGNIGAGPAGPEFQHLITETAPAVGGPWTAIGIPAVSAGQTATIPSSPGTNVSVRFKWRDKLGRVASGISTVSSITTLGIEQNDFTPVLSDLIDSMENAVISVITEYAVHNSETVAPTTGWSTTTPARTPGTFVWMRTKTNFADTTSSTSSPALITGNTGTSGTAGKGISSTAVTYQVGSSGTTAPTGTWVASPPATSVGQFLWTRTITTYTDTTTTTAYSVAAHGANGSNGSPGVGVSSTAVTYQVGSSGTLAPTGTWVTSPPATTVGQFLWTRTVTTYTDTSNTTAYSVAAHGATGSAGSNGTDSTNVVVGNDAVAIPTDNAGLTTTTHVITIPFSGWVGNARAAATAVVTGLPTGITAGTNTAATASADGSVILNVASGSNLGGGVLGEITLTITCNSKPFVKKFTWSKANQGAAGGSGTSATSVDLGNEATVIPCSNTGATLGASTITIPFTGYIGATRAAATVAVTGLPTGITVQTNTAGTSGAAGSLVLAVASGSTLGGVNNGTINLTITVNGIAFPQLFSWSKGITGAPGTVGKGISSVTTYYLQQGTGVAAPAAPTTNPPGGSWSITEPAYLASTEVYRADLYVFTDATFAWSSVSKMSAYTAASTKGTVYKTETPPPYDPNGLWYDPNDGNTPKVNLEKKALVRLTAGGSSVNTKLINLGWAVTVAATIPTLQELIDGGYSLFAIDSGYAGIDVPHKTLAAEAFAAGISVYTSGNDTSSMPPLFSGTAARDVKTNPVRPVGSHPVALGWTDFLDSDNNLYLTGVNSEAEVVGVTAVAGTDRPQIVVWESDDSVRWVHVQPYTATTQALASVFGWIQSRWASIQDVRVPQAITLANLAQQAAEGLVKPSQTDPGHSVGRIWMVLNASNQVIGLKVSNGSAWSSYVLMADQILVPSSVGTVSIADGAVNAPKVNAGSIWADEAWLNVLRAGVIEANMVTSSFASELTLESNQAITQIVTSQSALAINLNTVETNLASTNADITDLSGSVSTANGTAQTAKTAAEAAAALANANQAQLATTQTWFRVDAAGAHVGKSDSPFQTHILPGKMSITDNGIETSWWEAGRMVVPVLEATKQIVIARHQMEPFPSVGPTGTVIRSIS